ncbi:MAG: tyrosine recombinase [Armatimonadetes bacterium]|nr:MAG: tyrosine recombinase [Armatimonadota bacterium]
MCAEAESKLSETIEWFLDYLAVEKGASRHTLDAYHRDLMQAATLLRKAGKSDWSEYDSSDADALYAWLASRGASPTTVRRKLSSLRSFLRFLIREGVDTKGTLPEHSSARRPKRLPKALTHAEIEALLAAPDTTSPAGLRDRAMLETLYGCGLRVTECIGLAPSDVLPEQQVLRVLGKRSKVRLIPVPDGTLEWIERYRRDGRPRLVRPTSPAALFLNQRGGALSRSGVFRILQGYAKQAGIRKKFGPHTLRHTYAVHLVRAGADLRSVQELLGHESVATTEVYTFLDFETLRDKYVQAHPRAKGEQGSNQRK